MLIKQKTPSLPRNLVLGTFGELPVVFSTKVNLLYLLYSVCPEVLSSASDKAKLLKTLVLGWPSLVNWIGALTLSLLLKLPPRKLEPWFILWSLFLLRLLCISINLPHTHVWNTVVISGLLPLVATWNCWTSYKNKYAGLLVLHLLLHLNPRLIIEMWPV